MARHVGLAEQGVHVTSDGEVHGSGAVHCGLAGHG